MEEFTSYTYNPSKEITRKIRTILLTAHYCSICVTNNENLYLDSTEFEILLCGRRIRCPLKQIISDVFHDCNISTSQYVCQQCTDQVIRCFKFIKFAKEKGQVLCKYINTCLSETGKLHAQLDLTKFNISKVFMVLEDPLDIFSEESKSSIKKDAEKFYETNENQKLLVTNTVKRKYGTFKIRKIVANVNNLKPFLKKTGIGNITVQRNVGYECLSCKINFPKFSLWKEHERTTHKSILKCIICSKSFNSVTLLTAHYKVHSKLKCKICNILLPELELSEHLKLNHKHESYPCQYCENIYYNSKALAVHVKVGHTIDIELNEDENPQCLLCLQTFSKDKINIHKCKGKCPECTETFCMHYKYLVSFTEQKLNHDCKVKCVDCAYICRKKELLISHVNREHLNYHPFTCDSCGTMFHSKLQLKRHIYSLHMELFSCCYCDKQYRNAAAVKSHMTSCQVNIRGIKCMHCPASFNTLVELGTHEKLKHSSDNFSCDMCNRKFLTKENLLSHKTRSHRKVQLVKRSRVWLCGMCDKRFDTRGECVQHRKAHNPNEKYNCRICNIEFENSKHFWWHNRQHKIKEESCPEKCYICGKVVKSLPCHLRFHRYNMKKNASSFVCEKCGKSFTTYGIFKNHRLVHLDRIPCGICKKEVKPSVMAHHRRRHKPLTLPDKNYMNKTVRRVGQRKKCQYCDYIVSSSELLEAHLNRYHLNIKPYSCTVCQDSFCAEKNLKEHMKVHSDKRGFTCELCNNKFRAKACLRKHMLLHTGERPFVCDICGAGYTCSSSLKQHRLKHFSKNIACPLCTVMFHSLRNMRQHFKKQHWKLKDKKYNPKELLSKEHHYLFEDHRKIRIE